MDLSENSNPSKGAKERRAQESEDSAGLDFILDDNELLTDVPIHKPYIPDMENNEPPIHASDSQGKWTKPPAIPSLKPTSEAEVPPVQPEPAPKTQQYIPGMEEQLAENPEKTPKKSRKGNPVFKIVIVLLILAGGGYLGYQRFVKSAEKSEVKPANEAQPGEGKILITQANPKSQLKTQGVKIAPARPKPTAAQIQEAQTNIMGFFDRAKALVARQNARLQETTENANRHKNNASGEALATDTDSENAPSANGEKTALKSADAPAAEDLIYGQAPEGFKLTGTMNLAGDKLAFINDTVVTVGKVINDATVVEIGHRWVELKKDNLLFRLNMD